MMSLAFARIPGFVGIAMAMAVVQPPTAWAQTMCHQRGATSLFYGPPEPCGRVVDRLRVDPRARRDMSPWGATRGFAPFPDERAMPARQRLDGAYGQNTPRLR
jgi:hypothetical protein